MSNIIIGIDLGTSNICCSYWLNNTNNFILCNGNKTIPNIIYHHNNITKIGYDALDYINSEYCYHSLKRFINKNIDNHKFLYTELLKYIKNICDKYINNYDVIITVPSYFNDIHRNYTKECAFYAGLNCIRIINESTSACIAYGLNNNDEKTIMVIDIGAGTTDISFVNTDNEIIEVLSSYGDLELGGLDITNKIVEYVLSIYYEKFKKINDYTDLKNYLFHKCENIKINLSTLSYINEDFIIHNDKFSIHITQNILIDICKNIWKKIEEFIMHCLEKSKLSQEKIDYVILVGGSTKIPYIKTTIIKKIFHFNKILDSIDPDITVSIGASILGSIINGTCKKDMVVMDISQYSYGIEDDNGNFICIIEKNMPLPCKATKKFTTSDDNLNNIEIKIYQGDSNICKENYLIGKLFLDIENEKKGVPVINISFNLDVNNILTIFAEDKKTGKYNKLIIN
jgi:molecular chaperone DnaK (HSP70)